MGLRPVLLSGDDERAAGAVAAAVGIDQVVAGVLPAGKVDAIKQLHDSGLVAGFRPGGRDGGDGVNGAAALTQADLGWPWATVPTPRSRRPT